MIDIEVIKKEYDELLQKLSDPRLISDFEKLEKLSQRKKFLEKIIDKTAEIKEIENRIKESQSIISAKEDPELIDLAETEIAQLIERQRVLENEITVLRKDGLRPISTGEAVSPGEKKYSAVIVEIRAGTGGEEASLFAADLYRMYSKYALSLGWKQKVLDSRPTDLGGLKEIVFEISDSDVFSIMKHEAGVHRVQRIPRTEKLGRVHTSTITVAILPKPKKTEIRINPADLRVDFYRASGPGGQYVNKRETAVRITHLPTGLVVTSQTERNQLQNKENAMSILEAKVLEKTETEEEKRIAGSRKTQIGRAKRAEKIRTYNFPQDRVTDHRISKSWHNIESILDGKMEPIVKAFKKTG